MQIPQNLGMVVFSPRSLQPHPQLLLLQESKSLISPGTPASQVLLGLRLPVTSMVNCLSHPGTRERSWWNTGQLQEALHLGRGRLQDVGLRHWVLDHCYHGIHQFSPPPMPVV